MVETAHIEIVSKRLVMYVGKLQKRPGGIQAWRDALADSAECRICYTWSRHLYRDEAQ